MFVVTKLNGDKTRKPRTVAGPSARSHGGGNSNFRILEQNNSDSISKHSIICCMGFLLHEPTSASCSIMRMRPEASGNTPLAMAKRTGLSAPRGSGWKRLSLRIGNPSTHRGLPQSSTFVGMPLVGRYGHFLSSFMPAHGHDDLKSPCHRTPFPPYRGAISALAMAITSQWRWRLYIYTAADCIRDQSYCKR